jgi:F1F0 ATPase subunit 2
LLVRLELDAERMNITWFNSLPSWATALSLIVHFAVGVGLGAVYFRGLWWNARLFAEGASFTITIGLLTGRFVLLGSLLTLASLEGAMPLLVMTLGILVARSVVMHSLRRRAS